MIVNFEQARDEVKKFLPDYLQRNGLNPKSFSCPNKLAHSNADKNASASIIPGADAWYCHTENKGYDIFNACNFIEGKSLDGAGFLETLTYLAQMYGVPLDENEISHDRDETLDMFSAYATSLKVLKELTDRRKARSFTNARGWPSEGSFTLLSISSYDAYKKRLTEKYDEEFLVDIGLLDKNLFNANRILFPIYNHSGKLVAYTGRILSVDHHGSKYYNTKSYKLFDKSSLLYNFNACTNDPLYLVEGQSDCISMVYNKYPNTAAIGSTALSRKHIKEIIYRGITKVTLLLDNDVHGKIATTRAIGLFDESGIQISVGSLPDGIKDVDEFFRKGNKGLNSMSIMEWRINSLLEKHSPEDVVSMTVPIISQEENTVQKNKQIKHLADMTSISEKDIKETLNGLYTPTGEKKPPNIKKELKRIISSTYDSGDLVISLKQKILEIEKTNIIPGEDYSDRWQRDIDVWHDEVSRNDQIIGFETGFDGFTKKIDGWQKGCWYCFGGYSNIMKTGLMLEFFLRAYKYNDNLVSIFISLDDSKKMIIPRLLANMGNLRINEARKPAVLDENQFARYMGAKDMLTKMNPDLLVFGSQDIKSLNHLENIIASIKRNRGKDVIVFWDSHHTLIEQSGDLRTTHVKLANRIKDFADSEDIAIVSTVEFTKGDRRYRPGLNEIKESGDIEYRAKLIGLLHNDVHVRGINKANVYWTDREGARREVVEVNIAKNKTSEFKGIIPFKAVKEKNLFEEWPEREMGEFWDMYSR